MKHLAVGSEEAAKNLTAAIWAVSMPPGTDSGTSYSIGWRRTQSAWLLDLPEQFEVAVLNLAAAGEVLQLAGVAAGEAERNTLAATLILRHGQSVPLLDLLPAPIRSSLLDSDDLATAGHAPWVGDGPG